MISHLFEYTLNCSQLFVLHIFWLIKYFNLIKIIVNLLFNYDSIPIIFFQHFSKVFPMFQWKHH